MKPSAAIPAVDESPAAHPGDGGDSGGGRPMRALLIAEAANPQWVSVPLEGWSHSRAIAERADVDALVVTQVRNREAFVRAGLREGEDADFIAIDSEHIAHRLTRAGQRLRGGKGKGWTTVMAASVLAYYEFERLVWKRLGHRVEAGDYDLVHRITPLSPTTPSLTLARRCAAAGVPFIVGPLNGGVPWPKAYDRVRRAEREWLSYVRGIYKLMPGYRATRRLAAALIVGSQATHAQMPRRYHDKCFYVPENAIDPHRFGQQRTRVAAAPLHAVFVGRLVPYKGADVLLEAAAPLIRAGKLTVEIIGDGPQRPQLEAIIEQGGLGDGATLAGKVPHEQVQGRLIGADVFAFPSIREFGGAVVLEAMAVGVMPLVVAYGGPAELVSPGTGVALPIAPREQLVQQFRDSLAALVDDPARVDRLGAAAREHVLQHFTWEAKAHQTRAIYQWAVDPDHAEKPRCPMPIPAVASDPPTPAGA